MMAEITKHNEKQTQSPHVKIFVFSMISFLNPNDTGCSQEALYAKPV